MALRRLLALLVLICGGFLYADQSAPISIPPEPQRPATGNLTREQREATLNKWKADYKAWKDSLTDEQKAELRRQEENRKRDMQEAHRRATSLPLPTDGYTWQQAAAKRKLSPNTIEQLNRDRIAYGPNVKQSFDPYFSGPVFITSDSLLNAFHVLFEDSFRDYERRQTTVLRNSLESILTQARENIKKTSLPPSDMAPGWRHAQTVVGPALVLLGTPLGFFDADVRDEITSQVGKIKAAQAVELPTWLEPATTKLPALDYRSCKPIGFYSGDEKLSDYFRAVRWLQLVPFRLDRDLELVAIGMLSHYSSDRSLSDYSSLLGPQTSPGLSEAQAILEFQDFLHAHAGESWSNWLQSKRHGALRNAMSRDEYMALGRDKMPPNADALLAEIQFRIIPPHLLPDTALFQQLADKDLEPEGLAVASLLGSDFARNHLSHFTPERFDTALTDSRVQPAKIKNRNNQPSIYDNYLDVLRTLFTAPPNDTPAFMRNVAWQAKSCQTALSGWAQMRHTFTLQTSISQVYLGLSLVPPGFVEPNPEFFSRLADLIERARRILNGNRDRWDSLATITRKLEALAHKQLRLQPWTTEDEIFLKSYGARLGRIMGYDGNSYESPLDDAPRWTEVHRNHPKDYSLAVGVGRPRIIYVLYPWNGMEILCQGSVMSYYEYQSKERLTDAEWKDLLDSPKAPPQPDWLQPFLSK